MATSGAMADFARMPTNKKLLLLGAILGVFGFFYYKFAYSSLSDDVTAAKKTLTASRQKNKAIDDKIPLLNTLRAEKQDLEDTINQLQKALPTEAEVPAFFETLERKITAAGLEMKLKKGAEDPVESFVKVPLDVEITGTFMQIKRFFASLVEKKAKGVIVPGQDLDVVERERIVSIENLNLGQPTIRNREIVLTAKFNAVTFRQEDAKPDPAAKGAMPSTVVPAGGTSPGASAPPPLPSASSPAGAKARVDDSMKKDEQRVKDGTADPGSAGSARLKGGL
jgi:type IV pilus assembly protein PilO